MRRARYPKILILLGILLLFVPISGCDEEGSGQLPRPGIGRQRRFPRRFPRRRRQPEVKTPPQGAEIPAEFHRLYAVLDTQLTNFERQLDQRWDGSKYPVTFCAGLISANPNAGDALLNPRTLEMTRGYMDRLKSLGVKGIAVDLNFPLLVRDFYKSEEKYRQYLDFYKKLSAEVKRRGLVLAMEFTAVFPDFSPLPVAEYYKKLSFEQYKQQRLEMIRTIVTELKPDYLTVGNEPDTEAQNTGQPVNNVDNYVNMIQYYLSEMKKERVTGTKFGAGFGVWQKEYTVWARNYAERTGLDFINIHIYPVVGDLLERGLTIADIAKKNGKGIVLHEAWLYKWQPGEGRGVGNARKIYSRDAYRFWYPLDEKFLSIIVKMANYKKFDYISPFWSNYFFAYLDYDTAKSLSPAERMKTAILDGIKGGLAGQITPTGETYQKLISK